MKLSRLGEFGLIDRIRRKASVGRGVRLGIGDDAAWVDHPQGSSLITADLLIEGIHFDLRWTSLADLGDKSLAVNLSDIAAMGGVPAYAMLSLGIPANFDSKQLDEFYRGINGLAKKHGVTVVGGDTNVADSLLISVCVIGHPPSKPICRSGAHVGDDIYVTGTLGDAALGLELLRRKRLRQSSAMAQLLRRHHRPTPRLAAAALLARRNLPTAMIDISDGLIQDLGHICQASHVGATIQQDKLPLSQRLSCAGGKNRHAMRFERRRGLRVTFLRRAARNASVSKNLTGSLALQSHGSAYACGSGNGVHVLDASGAHYLGHSIGPRPF